jgi:hypothetical protein
LLRLRESLLSLSEEEPPRRIVLAAPPEEEGRRWWNFGFGSPGWGFAGACALAAAIVFHAVWAPAGSPEAVQTTVAPPVHFQPVAASSDLDEQKIQSLVDARVSAAVTKVRDELNAAHRQETARMVHAAEERLRTEHEQELLQVREAMSYMNKQYGRQLVANVALATELQSRELR